MFVYNPLPAYQTILQQGHDQRTQKVLSKANIVAIDYDPGASEVNQQKDKINASVARKH